MIKIIKDNEPIRDMTVEEIAVMKSEQAQIEIEHRKSMSYDEAVDAEIRKRYSVSQEFAILRQKDEKPEEYAEYYAYCEECKSIVKEMETLTV